MQYAELKYKKKKKYDDIGAAKEQLRQNAAILPYDDIGSTQTLTYKERQDQQPFLNQQMSAFANKQMQGINTAPSMFDKQALFKYK